jgi:hypothetical protein
MFAVRIACVYLKKRNDVMSAVRIACVYYHPLETTLLEYIFLFSTPTSSSGSHTPECAATAVLSFKFLPLSLLTSHCAISAPPPYLQAVLHNLVILELPEDHL